jgi:hypothetical protein
MQAIHQGPGRGLRENAGDAADRECDTDALLVPAAAGQVDRQERSDSGLYVRQQEIQPVQRMQGAGLGSRVGGFFRLDQVRCQRGRQIGVCGSYGTAGLAAV